MMNDRWYRDDKLDFVNMVFFIGCRGNPILCSILFGFSSRSVLCDCSMECGTGFS